jgi:hypothetical protein
VRALRTQTGGLGAYFETRRPHRALDCRTRIQSDTGRIKVVVAGGIDVAVSGRIRVGVAVTDAINGVACADTINTGAGPQLHLDLPAHRGTRHDTIGSGAAKSGAAEAVLDLMAR